MINYWLFIAKVKLWNLKVHSWTFLKQKKNLKRFCDFQIFSVHGETEARKASAMLMNGLRNVLKVDPLLKGDNDDDDGNEKVRVMNIVRLENSQFDSLANENKIQNALQASSTCYL